MFKFFIVMVPMFAGAALAGTVRAETMVALPTDAAAAPAAISTISSDGAPFQVVDSGPASAAHLTEPSTWAIMITGIGVVGAVSRRRRAHTVATPA